MTDTRTLRWLIRKGRPADRSYNPNRPWQLWRVRSDGFAVLKAQGLRHGHCVQVMEQLARAK